MDPYQDEVDATIYNVAARSLDGKPIGSVVMVSECIGYKKMGFWWNVQVHGLRAAIRQCWHDWQARRRA